MSIPLEKAFEALDGVKHKRKSRWSSRTKEQSNSPFIKYPLNIHTFLEKIHQDVRFDPLRALMGVKMLAIEGPKVQTNKKLAKLDEQTKDTKWGAYWEKNFQTPLFHTIPKGIS